MSANNLATSIVGKESATLLNEAVDYRRSRVSDNSPTPSELLISIMISSVNALREASSRNFTKGSGDWLNALPASVFGLALTDDHFNVYFDLVSLPPMLTDACDTDVDELGHLALVCKSA